MNKRLVAALDRKTAGMILATVLGTFVLIAALASPVAAGGINPFGRSDFTLTDDDLQILQEATSPFFADETVPLNTERTWKNPKTGNAGTATLVSRFKYKEMPCRRIQHDIKLSTVGDPFRFIIDRCQVADGSWKML